LVKLITSESWNITPDTQCRGAYSRFQVRGQPAWNKGVWWTEVPQWGQWDEVPRSWSLFVYESM